jgi:hypothetical protein
MVHPQKRADRVDDNDFEAVDAIEDAETVLYQGQFNLGLDQSDVDTDVPAAAREYLPDDEPTTEVPAAVRVVESEERPLSRSVWVAVVAALAVTAVILALSL